MTFNVGSKTVKSEINVTPLVDVVLVLLIIFMVITPLLERGKPVELPSAQSVSEQKRGGEPIFLSITADGRLWVEKNEVALGTVAEMVSTAMAVRPGAPLVLKGDRSLDYKTVRHVLAELAKANLAGISLAANQPGGQEAK
jgi:biopolymer transport protein TolR